MTDVVELLRAEIERLREDVAEWKQAASVEAGLHMTNEGFYKEQAEYWREIARDIRAAAIEECAKPLEQIRQVCADNAGEGSVHKMALDFVHQIAIRALKERP